MNPRSSILDIRCSSQRQRKEIPITDPTCELSNDANVIVYTKDSQRLIFFPRINHLEYLNGRNDILFALAGIDGEQDKMEFASKHYGYQAAPGVWPEYRLGDHQALKRLLCALLGEESAESIAVRGMVF